MLNADFQRLAKKKTSATYYALARGSYRAARGQTIDPATIPARYLLKDRLVRLEPVHGYESVNVYSDAPGDLDKTTWPGNDKPHRYLTTGFNDTYADLRRQAENTSRTKKYLFTLHDDAGQIVGLTITRVADVLGAWTSELDARVSAETAVALEEEKLAESRQDRLQRASEEGQRVMESRREALEAASAKLLGGPDRVRISTHGSVGWDDVRNQPKYSVAGTVSLTVQDYSKLLNLISELQSEVGDRK